MLSATEKLQIVRCGVQEQVKASSLFGELDEFAAEAQAQ